MHSSTVLYTRILYLLSALAWWLILWPNPVTVFMAGCTACLTLPRFRRLRRFAGRMRRKALPAARRRLQEEIRAPRLLHPLILRWRRNLAGMRFSCIDALPLTAFLFFLIGCIVAPVALFLALVAPQVGAGFARLHAIWANNFQLPAEWTEFLDKRFAEFQSMPIVGKIVGEGRALVGKLTDYFSNFSADTVTSIINNGFNVLGGTMSVVWTFFLYLVLTVIFVIYAARIRVVAARIFRIRASVLRRFVHAIHNALKGIFMGVIFVAAIQGFLCGIGFAIVGFGQFAFWGLLATLVAPIPVVGTALVWLPLSIQLWFSGQTVEAVTLVLWGAIIVSTADSVLRPLFLKQGIKASFLVLIVVILCGISTFGAVGLILGPVLLAFAIQAIEEGGRAYRSRFSEADLEPAQAGPEDGLPATTEAGAAAPAEGEAK